MRETINRYKELEEICYMSKFSWQKHKDLALKMKIERAKNAIRRQDPDYKLKYPHEARAGIDNLTEMKKRVKEEHVKFIKQREEIEDGRRSNKFARN